MFFSFLTYTFGHSNILKFTDNGKPIRPYASVDEMHDALINNWNSVVTSQQDLVYVLGDISINKKFMPMIGQCRGRKKLVRGNHDNNPTKEYLEFFESIYGVKVMSGMVLSHIPLHRESVVPRMGVNVHGHLHSQDIPDGAYFNVSVENINFTPIEINDLRVKIKEKQEKYPHLNYSGTSTGNGPT